MTASVPTHETEPRRVLFVAPSLEGGGAERALCTLLRFLDRSRYEPSLALLSRRGPYLGELPPDVPVYDLHERSPYDWLGPLRRLQALLDLAEPHVVVGFLRHPNLLSLLASQRSRRRAPVVAVEHSLLSRSLSAARAGFLKKRLYLWLYPQAAAVVAVSPGVKADLAEQLGTIGTKALVVPNLCDLVRVEREAAAEPDEQVDWQRPTLVTVGRLEAVKGHDLLVEALSRSAASPRAQLLILGDGPCRAELQVLARRLAIMDRVHFLGFRPNPFAYMARAQAVVLSSRWEASPNVLVEAMACGAPVVSTDCPHGPREILDGGAAGLLVRPRSADALAEGLDRVLADGGLRERLAAAGKARAQAYAADAGARRYEAVLDAACLGNGVATEDSRT